MSQLVKRIISLCLLGICLSPMQIMASNNEQENVSQPLSQEDQAEYIRWFGTYDEQSQLTLEEIQTGFEKILAEGSTETSREEVIAMLGDPAETFSVGASEFLVYYSINDEESNIVYVQLFSKEKAAEMNSMDSTGDASETNEVAYDDAYLNEVNLMVVNESAFAPLNVTEEEVSQWQDESEDDHVFENSSALIERIGQPSEITYNFESSTWRYAWIRNSEVITDLNYLLVETDQDGKITFVDTVRETEEEHESLDNDSSQVDESTD